LYFSACLLYIIPKLQLLDFSGPQFDWKSNG
jgi:hypothetical protein